MNLLDFFRQKQPMHFEAFVRMILGMLIGKAAYNFDPEISNELSESEIKKFKDEVFYLRLMILTWLLLVRGVFGRKSYSAEEIGEIIGRAAFLGFQDNGMSKAESEVRTDTMLKLIEEYMEAVQSGMEKTRHNKEERDIFFHLLTHFSDRALRDSHIDLKTEEGRNKHMIVFSLANQIYRNDSRAYKAAIRKVRFLE